VSVAEHFLRSDEAHNSTGIGFDWRLGTGTSGWGWGFGFGWYATDLDRGIGGRTVNFGELRVRPIVASYGYTHRFRRFTATADLSAGYAFTSFSMTPEASAAIARAPERSMTTDVSNTAILKPEAGLWYDINSRFGISLDLAYIVARPNLTVTSALGRESRSLRADAFVIQTGLVYSIF